MNTAPHFKDAGKALLLSAALLGCQSSGVNTSMCRDSNHPIDSTAVSTQKSVNNTLQPPKQPDDKDQPYVLPVLKSRQTPPGPSCTDDYGTFGRWQICDIPFNPNNKHTVDPRWVASRSALDDSFLQPESCKDLSINPLQPTTDTFSHDSKLFQVRCTVKRSGMPPRDGQNCHDTISITAPRFYGAQTSLTPFVEGKVQPQYDIYSSRFNSPWQLPNEHDLENPTAANLFDFSDTHEFVFKGAGGKCRITFMAENNVKVFATTSD